MSGGLIFRLVKCFSYYWICRDSLWIQITVGFCVPHSGGLVFPHPIGFVLSPRRFSHGSDHSFSSGKMDGFSKDAFSSLSDYVKDMSKFQRTYVFHM